MGLEYKAGAAEFRASAGEGEYEGYFAVTGNVDDGGDVIEKGAFKKTLQERGGRVRVFWGHDPLRPIGPPPTLIVEDSKGLFVKGRLSVNSFWGREAWALLKDGALTEGSIGYQSLPGRAEWKSGVRHLFEVKLFEVSFVALGMNPATTVRANKQAGAMLPLYNEVVGRVAFGLKGVAGLNADDLEAARRLRGELGLALGTVDALFAAVEPVGAGSPGHSALQLRERARRLGLASRQE